MCLSESANNEGLVLCYFGSQWTDCTLDTHKGKSAEWQLKWMVTVNHKQAQRQHLNVC